EIFAVGRRMQTWSIDYRIIEGDTSILSGPKSPYPVLDRILSEQFPSAAGGTATIRRLAIDSGYNTSTVYQWAWKHQTGSRVLACDGRANYQMMIGQPKTVDVSARGKRRIGSVKLWPVGDGMVKTELYGWLKQDKPTAESGEEAPWGYCHFPEYPEEYFRGITAEEIVPRLVKGFRRYQWEKVYDRNEPLDCRKYGRAAVALDGIERWTEAQWDAAERELVAVQPDKPAVTIRKPKNTRANDPYL
ncbi:MAG: terminase gpA endonuclease subunit, partial [Steroidobacteraceae bacterium]